MPQYRGRCSEEKCAILEKDVELLWKKVSVYEHYGNSERNLRNKAVEELNKKKQRFKMVKVRMSKNQTKYGKQFGKNQTAQGR